MCVYQSSNLLGVKLTVSGVSLDCTLSPSNKNLTVDGDLPCRSQNASMSFFSCVVRFILKKTSLLLSVTLMLRCSDGCGCGGTDSSGLLTGTSWSDIFVFVFVYVYVFFLFCFLWVISSVSLVSRFLEESS